MQNNLAGYSIQSYIRLNYDEKVFKKWQEILTI